MKLLQEFFILLLSFSAVYVLQLETMSSYIVPLIGLLIVLYLIFSLRKGFANIFTLDGNSIWVIFIINTVILLVIFGTGNISSSLFFLLYFLLFGIAFVFEPVSVFIFVLGSILVFLPDALLNDTLGNFIRLGSLALISPIAFFFGKEYRKNDEEEEKLENIEARTRDAADTIAHDVEQVLKREKDNLEHEDLEQLNDILEETEDLRAETKE